MAGDVYGVIRERRSIRQFDGREVPRALIERCVDAARLAPSSANLQPLDFIAAIDPDLCARIFPLTKWAAYLKDWSPPESRRPRAYVALAVDRARALPALVGIDVGLAAAHILLTAESEGVSGCLLGAFDGAAVKKIMRVPDSHDLPLLVALGYPAERAVAEPLADSHKYWRDSDGVHHVPKRSLSDVIHWDQF